MIIFSTQIVDLVLDAGKKIVDAGKDALKKSKKLMSGLWKKKKKKKGKGKGK